MSLDFLYNNNSKLIFRDNIQQKDNIFDVNAYLSGNLDFLYDKERKTLDSQLEE